MVAFSKTGDCLKNSDSEDTSFIYRELRSSSKDNPSSNETLVTCTNPVDVIDDEPDSGTGIILIEDDETTNFNHHHHHHHHHHHNNHGTHNHQEQAERNFNCTTVVSTVILVVLVCFLLVVGRDYVRYTLLWLENQEEYVVFVLFVFLFTLVSFPFTWGYILLNVACGYLQGLVLGVVLVVIAVAVGVVVSHLAIKRFLSDFFKNKLMANESIRATLAVVGGPHAFRVVAFTRLTPIPFGLQNAIFAISTVSTGQYLAASIVGLFPTQVINVYLGSTVRSMEDVLTDDSTATTGYIVFIVQVLISVGLMVFVVQRARQELRKTVQFQILGDLKEISVTSQDCYNGNCSSI